MMPITQCSGICTYWVEMNKFARFVEAHLKVLNALKTIATKGPHDYVQRLGHLRNVCYKHMKLHIVFCVMFTELILVYYLIEN